MTSVTFLRLPTCATGSVQSGDPTKGTSILLIKASAVCFVPWHCHTPNENLMMASGVGHVEIIDGKPLTLRAGGYAMMPSHHVHQFHCGGLCSLYIYSDALFDIHYVDGQGNEISPDNALKAVKETTATEMKYGPVAADAGSIDLRAHTGAARHVHRLVFLPEIVRCCGLHFVA